MTSTNDEQHKGKHQREIKRKFKIVLRRLPHAMTETELMEQLGEIPYASYFLFTPANPDLGKHSMPRATLVLDEERHVLDFSARFNGYIFVDNKGNSSPAMVELAPAQDIPRYRREHVCRDKKINQVEDMEGYQQFVQMMEESLIITHISVDDQLKEIQARHQGNATMGIETPLTRFVMQKTIDKSRKLEEKRHQRDLERRARFAAKQENKQDKHDQSGKSDTYDEEIKDDKVLEFVSTSNSRRERRNRRERYDGGENYREKEKPRTRDGESSSYDNRPLNPNGRPDKKRREPQRERVERTDDYEFSRPSTSGRGTSRRTPIERRPPARNAPKVEREIYRPGRLRRMKEAAAQEALAAAAGASQESTPPNVQTRAQENAVE